MYVGGVDVDIYRYYHVKLAENVERFCGNFAVDQGDFSVDILIRMT
jgi:hypothetical protein